MPKWKYIFVLYIALCLIIDVVLPSNLHFSYVNYLFPVVFVLLINEYRQKSAFMYSMILAGGFCLYQVGVNVFIQPLSFAEVLWSFQYLKIFTLFWCGYFAWEHNKHLFSSLIDLVFVLLALINIIQLMEVSAMLEFYAPSANYLQESSYSILDSRLYGSFLNPNNNALALLLFLVYYLFSERDLKWSFVVISGCILFMTQSRTALLLMLMAIGIFVFFKSTISQKKLAIVGVLGIALFSGLLAVFKFDYILMLIDGRIFSSSSFLTRADAVNAVIDINKGSWLIGQGKVSDIPSLIGYSVDNQYMYTYLEYGIVGVMLFALLVVYAFKKAIKPLNLISTTLLLCLIFAGLSNLSFSNGELLSIYTALLASSFFLNTESSNTKHSR